MPETPVPPREEASPRGGEIPDPVAARAIGGIMIGVGLAIGCYTIGWPLYQAYARVPEISISLKRTVLPIFLVLFGTTYVVGINPFGKLFDEGHHITFFDIVRLLALAAIGLGAEYLLKQHIESLGYRFPL